MAVQPSLEQETFFAPPEPVELDTRERLRVLSAEDSRAHFLPTTHIEKNWALALLDYIDILDPSAGLKRPGKPHPAKAAGQLNEVFLYHKKLQRKKYPDNTELAKTEGEHEGQRAMRSIAFVFGDFLANATEQKDALRQLELDVKDCPNPRVTLTEELGAEHPGFAPFVRYFDLREVLRSGILRANGFDPLKTVEVREDVEEPDRRKYIEDQYTASEVKPEVAARIGYVAGALTIGSVRATITRGNFDLSEAAVIDQQHRISFWTARLREARLHGAARPIADRVLKNLNIALR